MANESVYIGTDLKIKVDLRCEGFDMDKMFNVRTYFHIDS